MGYENFSNAPQTLLSAAITSTSATTISVLGNGGFPSSGNFRILIDNEIMLVTAGATGLTWTVTRGVEGTIAATHANGATVSHILTAGALVAGFEQRGTQSIAYAAIITPDVSQGALVIVGVLTGNVTINAPLNPQSGQRSTFQFTQDVTGGRTITWNAVFNSNWQPNPKASSTSTIEFQYDGTNWQQVAANTAGGLVASSLAVTGGQPGRYVPNPNAYGAPTSGTYLKGDWTTSNASGSVFVCTVAGSPGTWVVAGGQFNVLDYGAKGDGVTDDTTAIQAAVTAWQASGGTLFFPSGTYKTTAKISLTAQANTYYEIRGAGFARIQPTQADPGGEDGALVLNGLSTARLTIRNLRVDKFPAATTTGSLDGILIQPITSGQANFSGVLLEEVAVTGFSLWNFSIVNASKVSVINCQGNNSKNGGLEFVGGSDIVVMGGDYSGNVSSTGGSDYGIAFASSSVYGPADGVLVQGVQANNNGRKGIDAHHAIHYKVIGNTVIGNGASSLVTTPSGIYAVCEDSTKTVRDVVIADNYIDMSSSVKDGHGIEIGGAGSAVPETGSFVIQNNIIRGCDTTANSGAIYCYTPAGGTPIAKIVISGNTMENAAGTTHSAVLFANTGQPHLVVISGNAIHINGAAAGGITAQGIDRSIITDNILEFGGAATNGIFASGGTALITENHLLGTAPTNPINQAGAGRVHTNWMGGALIPDALVTAPGQTNLKIASGSITGTVNSGTRTGTTAGVTFGVTFTNPPLVFCTILQNGVLATAENPAVGTPLTISTTGVSGLEIDLATNAGANRTVTVQWVAVGV